MEAGGCIPTTQTRWDIITIWLLAVAKAVSISMKLSLSYVSMFVHI